MLINNHARQDKAPLQAFPNHSNNYGIRATWRFFYSQNACPLLITLTQYSFAELSTQNQILHDNKELWESHYHIGKHMNMQHYPLKPYQITNGLLLVSLSHAFLQEWHSNAHGIIYDEYTDLQGQDGLGQHSHSMNDWLWKQWFQSFWIGFEGSRKRGVEYWSLLQSLPLLERQ